MGQIRRLSEAVANQIAAGEVVERPASVVKELVENALDAQATRIEVAIEGGGTGLIRISDDGIGMSPEDAELCLERHATSKIRVAEDLETVLTMGFRGEALPSIASVSRLSLTTRRAEDEAGTRILIEGGRRVESGAFGAPAGTTLEVSDLFFNVPARRKFLKSPSTEMSHLTDAVVRLALARPEVGFRLSSEGRSLIDAPGHQGDDPRGRLGRILGRPVADRLYPVLSEVEPARIRVTGWVGAPEISERTSRGLYTFVNGRFVRERTIQHAIQEAYRALLEKGRYPLVVLFLELDPQALDVNVHPQKTEVRFQSTQDVHRAITTALTRTLGPQPWLDRHLSAVPPAAERRYLLNDQVAPSPRPILEPSSRPWLEPLGPVHGSPRSPAFDQKPSGRYVPELPLSFGVRDGGPPRFEAAPPGRFGSLEPIGQALGRYLVCQASGRLVLIDQQAAHQRITFERLKAQRAGQGVEVQPLLVPITVELDPAKSALLAGERGRLQSCGFELEPFGGETWLLKSAPAALGGAALLPLLIDLLDHWKELDSLLPLEERLDRILGRAASHASVRGGDRLGWEELRALLVALDQVDFSAHGPAGRPVYLEWSEAELQRLFHRS